jgi:predicted phage terminase large subunit-like protein
MIARSPIRLPNPHPGQRDLIHGERRFNVACMGRRFGKSAFGVNRLIKEGYWSKQPVGWFAPQYKLLDEAWREIRQRLFQVISRADSQQHRLELLGGGTIDFWTLDTPDAGRSRKYALVIIDEAAMARNLEEAWTAAIRPTLADLQGSAWFLSTPKGSNYFKTLFDRAADDPDWARWQMPTSSNPYIKASEIEAMRLELPSIIYQQEVLAQFVDLEGAAMKRDWLRYEEPPVGLSVVLGVDLAISVKSDSDYSAIVAVSRDSAGTIYVRDAQRIRAPFHQVLQFIQQMADKWHPTVIAIEEVQYQAAVVQELARTTNLPVKGVRPDKDKLTRFLPLLARYEKGLVKHVPGLPGWFEEELLSFPVGANDDGVDALVYSFQASTPTADYYPPALQRPAPARQGRF